MKKIVSLIVIVFIMVGIIYLYTTQQTEDKSNETSTYLTDKRILELSQNPSELGNFIFTVKENPTQVIKTNSLLRKMVYSGEYEQAEVESLVNMQRLLFHEDLLSNNPKEFHQLIVKGELEKWEKAEMKIIGSEYLSPQYQGKDNNQAVIKVVFYTNDPERDIYSEYYLLRNDNKQWEIMGWATVEPFDIVK